MRTVDDDFGRNLGCSEIRGSLPTPNEIRSLRRPLRPPHKPQPVPMQMWHAGTSRVPARMWHTGASPVPFHPTQKPRPVHGRATRTSECSRAETTQPIFFLSRRSSSTRLISAQRAATWYEGPHKCTTGKHGVTQILPQRLEGLEWLPPGVQRHGAEPTLRTNSVLKFGPVFDPRKMTRPRPAETRCALSQARSAPAPVGPSVLRTQCAHREREPGVGGSHGI